MAAGIPRPSRAAVRSTERRSRRGSAMQPPVFPVGPEVLSRISPSHRLNTQSIYPSPPIGRFHGGYVCRCRPGGRRCRRADPGGVRGVRPTPATEHRHHRRGQPRARRRRDVELADRAATGRVDEPRPRLARVGHRRQRVRRHARRVRRLDRRPRPSGHRRGGDRPGRPRHPLRPAHRGRDLGRGGAAPALPAAAVAVRQLRHRGDDGRHPPDARAHRARPDHQGRGLLPRPPRLGAGLGAARGRRGRAGRPAAAGAAATRASPRRSRTSSSSSRSTTSAPWSAPSPSTPARSPG